MELLVSDCALGRLIRTLRQGMYFGVQARLPYSLTAVIRPHLFGQRRGPLVESLRFQSRQALQHGWIIARIAVAFKVVEALLQRPSFARLDRMLFRGWETFAAGAVSGYLVMVADGREPRLKKQINMAVGIRTLYAFLAYMRRTGRLAPFLRPGGAPGLNGRVDSGTMLWYTLLWGFVMWHWKHQTAVAPGEMLPAQVKQMDFIYKAGDEPGWCNWAADGYWKWVVLFVGVELLEF